MAYQLNKTRTAPLPVSMPTTGAWVFRGQSLSSATVQTRPTALPDGFTWVVDARQAMKDLLSVASQAIPVYLYPEVEESYTVESAQEVRDFIHRNVYLRAILREAFPKIRGTFADAPIRLRFIPDPEISSLDHLVAAIVVDETDPEEILARLDRMEKDWLFDLQRRARNKFLVDVEFS